MEPLVFVQRDNPNVSKSTAILWAGWALGIGIGCFLFGLAFTTGENDHIYWELRGPLWVIGAALVVLSLVLYAVARGKD